MVDYFTLDELNALPDMPDFDDSQYEDAGGWIEDVIEREVDTSFVTRTITDEVHDGGTSTILLRSSYAVSITSIIEDGIDITTSISSRSGVLRKVSGTGLTYFSAGIDNVVVTYEAGYSATPPADIKQAALNGARAYLLEHSEFAGMDARRTSISTDMGVVSFTTAGENRPTGYPEVDAVILGWKKRIYVPKVA